MSHSLSARLSASPEGAGDDTSISGFKDTLSDQSGAESANEALSHDVTVSPDAVSATSQSTDDPARDLVTAGLQAPAQLFLFAAAPLPCTFIS